MDSSAVPDSFTLQIAQKNIAVSFPSELARKYCCSFITDQTPDFDLSVTDSDIEMERSLRCDFNLGRVRPLSSSQTALEMSALLRALSNALPEHGAFLIHGSAISYADQGLIFVAPSGTGKSTYSLSWKTCFPEEVEYINDDKPFVGIRFNLPIVYGSPWRGKHGRGSNTSVPLKAICFIHRSEKNTVQKLSAVEALPLLVTSVHLPEEASGKKAVFDIISKLSKTVDYYSIGCNMDADACIVAKETIYNDA